MRFSTSGPQDTLTPQGTNTTSVQQEEQEVRGQHSTHTAGSLHTRGTVLPLLSRKEAKERVMAYTIARLGFKVSYLCY